MIQKIVRLLLAALVYAAPGLSLADADSHRAAVEQLFKLTHMEQKVNESVDNVLLIQLQQSPQLEPHRQALDDFLQKHIGWSSMKEAIATALRYDDKVLVEKGIDGREIEAVFRTQGQRSLLL